MAAYLAACVAALWAHITFNRINKAHLCVNTPFDPTRTHAAGAIGLQTTSDGRPKIIDLLVCEKSRCRLSGKCAHCKYTCMRSLE